MTFASLTATVLAIGAPIALYATLVRRRGPTLTDAPTPSRRVPQGSLVVSFVLGALLFLPAWFIERWIEGWAGVDAHARTATDATALVYALLVAAPLEEGLKVAAVTPAWRTRMIESAGDGALLAATAAMGFVSAHNLEHLATSHATVPSIARALLAVPAHAFFAGAWGYALGWTARRTPSRRIGGLAFNATWLLCTLLNGAYDHLVFARGNAALVATIPILAAMGVTTFAARRSLSSEGERPSRVRGSFMPASVGALREALWKSEKPVMVHWIAIGALVTLGVVTAALVTAVALGNRLGIDFAAVDRPDRLASSAAPLLLLSAAALAAFPVAGYLVARASGSRSVIEAASAAALAIVGGLVLLGLAAPVAVVFAIAFAPIALGLLCAGAWLGIQE